MIIYILIQGWAIFLVRGPFQKKFGPFGPHFLTNKYTQSEFYTPRAGQKALADRTFPTPVLVGFHKLPKKGVFQG